MQHSASQAMSGSLRPGKEYRRQTPKRFEPLTVLREQPNSPGLIASRPLRDRRLVQATWATILAICVTALPDLLAQRWHNMPPLATGLAALGIVLLLVRQGRRDAA